MTEREIEELAEQKVNEFFPTQQRELLSVNKCDWKAGFILGFKKCLEILDLNIRKAGP